MMRKRKAQIVQEVIETKKRRRGFGKNWCQEKYELLPELKHAVILISMHSFKRKSMTITSRSLAAEQTINKRIAGQYFPVNITPLGIFTVSFVRHHCRRVSGWISFDIQDSLALCFDRQKRNSYQ
jgi:hypothetical protein